MENRFKVSQKVGIVSCPLAKANIVPYSNYIDILSSLTDNLVAIAPCKRNVDMPVFPNVSLRKINYHDSNYIYLSILSFIWIQFKIIFNILSFRKIDTWVFYIGEGLIFPILTAKILKKNVFLSLGGYSEKEISLNGKAILKILPLVKSINLMVSDYIILYSPILIQKWGLSKYRHKILIAHKHHLDFNRFNMKVKNSQRRDSIGYIGRLSSEKGVLNFVRSIPILAETNHELNFLIGGDGPLKEEIVRDICLKKMDNVNFVGWIAHENLPAYLNSVKIIVLPSCTEGLPNIILEAMACGTIVLTTPVGAIPDIVKDGETGFIMDNNYPELIAENVTRILKHPDLDKISENAMNLVRLNFSYEAAVEKYRKIIGTQRGC